MAVAFLYGSSKNRADRDQQLDAILTELSGRNIPVDNFMAPRSHSHPGWSVVGGVLVVSSLALIPTPFPRAMVHTRLLSTFQNLRLVESTSGGQCRIPFPWSKFTNS